MKNWIYGINTVSEIVQSSPKRISEFCCLENSKNPRLNKLCSMAEDKGITVNFIDIGELNLRAKGNHQGVAVCCEMKETLSERDLLSLVKQHSADSLLLILDGINDPHNFGACLRSAHAAGAHAVVIPKARSVGVTPVVRKVACGAAEIVPIAVVPNLNRVIKRLKEEGIWIVGASSNSKAQLYDVDLKGPVGIILGGEEKGLRQSTERHCDIVCKIPMMNEVESLNVSVATGIYLFETLRQRL